MLFFFLNLNPHHGKTLWEHAREFDFVGLFLFVGGVVCLLLGFSQSQNGCKCVGVGEKQPFNLEVGDKPATIALLVIGCVALILGVLFENWTDRSPIIPPRLFKVGYLLNFSETFVDE
jgi:hypothetical protein